LYPHPSWNVQIKKYCCPEFVTQDVYTYFYFKKFMREGSYKIIDQRECKEWMLRIFKEVGEKRTSKM
jgi:hypothetical protein